MYKKYLTCSIHTKYIIQYMYICTVYIYIVLYRQTKMCSTAGFSLMSFCILADWSQANKAKLSSTVDILCILADWSLANKAKLSPIVDILCSWLIGP